MRVLLVFAAYEHLSKVTSAPFPLGLGYLASYLVSKNIDVAIADLRYGSRERFKKILVEYRPEIVGISCMTPNQNEAYNTARTVRKILGKSLVIMGGVHATFMYDQILQNVREIDAVVIGEGEITLWELCREWSESKSVDKFYHINGIAFRKNGTVVVTPPRERIDQLDELPYPAFDRVVLPDIREYLRLSNELPVLTSRGCPFQCAFCSTSVMHGKKYRKRDPVKTVDELEYLKNRYNPDSFSVVDDTFTVDRERIKKICHEIIRRKLDIKWGCSARADTLTPELIKLMSSAGCKGVFFGIESLDDEVLKKIKKGFHAKSAVRMVKLLMDEGITVDVSFILGLPGDNLKNTRRIYNFVKRYKPNGRVLINTLQILPGTDMYMYPERYGIKYSRSYRSTWTNPVSFAKDLPLKVMLREKIRIQTLYLESMSESLQVYEIPFPLVCYDEEMLPGFARR